MNTDYSKFVEEAKKLVQDLTSIDNVNQLSFLCDRMRSHLQEKERLELRSRGVSKYMRLKETVTIRPIYDSVCGIDSRPARTFEAGTLIECNENGVVYIDDDGDGCLYFPREQLEAVEIPDFDPNVDWNKVVYQG